MKCACRHSLYSCEVHQLFFSFIILLLIQCTDSCQTCIHRQCLFGLFLIFCFLSAKLGGLRACRFDATSSHALLLCWATKKKDYIAYSLQTLFLKRDVLLNWPCMLDMYGSCFFFLLLFCAWRCPFCRMTPAWHSFFILRPSSLFWDSDKKVTGLLTHPPTYPPTPPASVTYTSAFQLCWSAPPSAVIRLQRMRKMHSCWKFDRRGSWCKEGGKRGKEKKTSPTPSFSFYFLEVLVCCYAYIVI